MRLRATGITLFCCLSAFAQSESTYKPGDFQRDNPNYMTRNPFYFEGRVDWNLLKVETPTNAWEFAQRGIYRQEDLRDIEGAIADYRQSISLNNLANETCQLITSVPTDPNEFANLNPPPCMFTVRLRLAYLIHKESPLESIALYREVLDIDPLRLGVNALIGETYEEMAGHAATPEEEHADLEHAVEAFKAELALAPVTPLSVRVTGDEANNPNIHWELAHVYEELGQRADAAKEYDLYLKATKWHSDTYPWRIELAKKKLAAAE